MLNDENYQNALSYVLKNEGGFVDNPSDPGKATNFGITLSVLSDCRGRDCTPQDVRELTQGEAGLIYYMKYWIPLSCEEINQESIATALFDVGVLFGVGVSAVLAQQALQENGYKDLSIDGNIGPESIAALNLVDLKSFLNSLYSALLNRINYLIERNVSLETFRTGWVNRINKLLALT